MEFMYTNTLMDAHQLGLGDTAEKNIAAEPSC